MVTEIAGPELLWKGGCMKRNRFEVAVQALLLSVGVILTVVLISVMIVQFEQARNMSDAVSENMLEVTERIRNSDLTQYDGLRVSGAEVRNFFKLNVAKSGPKGFTDLIIDNGSGAVTYWSSSGYSEITDNTGNRYVCPTDVYLCSVDRNINEVITTIKFTRQ